MSEIKSVVSVIKILERTIGILENCNDFGKIPDTTRKRVIEMLNKVTLEIYFVNAQESNSSDRQISETKRTEKKEIAEPESEWETVSRKFAEENISEKKTIEPVPEECVEEEFLEEEYVPNEEMFVTEENVYEEDTIPEESIFQQQDPFSNKPIIEWKTQEIEWKTPEVELVTEMQESKDAEINLLKLQLEEERKRLEQELQNWQDERRKKDEEILAAKKLLDALQQQTAINKTQTQSQLQQSRPQQIQPQTTQPVRRVQQPSQPQQQTKTEPPIKKEEIVKKNVRKEEPQEPSTLIDSYMGSKKVLYENFESTNMVNQISTPVSSLAKAIGINDKFRFIKELFGGDSDLYNETIKALDMRGSLIAAISYIEANFSWDKNSDSVKQLISLVRRRYM